MTRGWRRVCLAAAVGLLAGCTGGLPRPAQIESAEPAALSGMESILRAELEPGERDEEVLFLLSRVTMRQGRLQEAELLALEASQRAPFRADLLYSLGEIHLRAGERFRALLAFSQAIGVDPKLLDAYARLALLQHDMGDSERAKETLTQAIHLEPQFYEARYALARVRLETGDAPAAETEIERARQIRPQSGEAALLHVRILKTLGRLADARFVIEHRLEVEPRSTRWLRELLDVHHQRHDWPAVQQVLERLAPLGEPAVNDLLVRADWMQALGDGAGAADLRADLLRRFPRDPSVLVAAGRGLLAANRPRKALRALSDAADVQPDFAEAHYWRAVAHYRLDERLEGDLALNRAQGLDPQHPGARRLRVRRLIAERRPGPAAVRLNAYLQEFPADREGLLLRAELLTLTGDYAKAERTLKSLDPPDPGIRFARARLLYLQGQYRAVLGETAVLTALPQPPWEAVYLAAAALGRLGRASEALELARPHLDREESRGAFHRLVGELLQRSGDLEAAQRTYEAGLRRYPRDLALIEGLTRLALSREDWRTARSWLESGVERPSPYLPGFLERLERVYRRTGERDKAEEALARYLAAMDPLLREPGEVPDQAILFRMSLPPMRLGSGNPVRARDSAGAQEASPDPSASSNPNASNPSR